MRPTTNGRKANSSSSSRGENPNWVLIAGGALLTTLSVRLGYKLKQLLDAKNPDTTFTGNRKYTHTNNSTNSHLHHNAAYCFHQDQDQHHSACYNCLPGSGSISDIKQQSEMALPLVTVSAPEFNKENNGVMWSSSPDRLELPQKPFHHSNSSDSPCMSESGSDIYSKREVIQKLRQQLKRRDEMILEMQDQIAELQNSLGAQLSHSAHLQSLLDATNRDLLGSEREIQRLRKAIADHCVDARNGHTNGYIEHERNSESSEKGRGRGENERIEMLKREVGELKEVIQGKEFLVQSYKEQKVELAIKVNDLQQKLDSQLPNIL